MLSDATVQESSGAIYVFARRNRRNKKINPATTAPQRGRRDREKCNGLNRASPSFLRKFCRGSGGRDAAYATMVADGRRSERGTDPRRQPLSAVRSNLVCRPTSLFSPAIPTKVAPRPSVVGVNRSRTGRSMRRSDTVQRQLFFAPHCLMVFVTEGWSLPQPHVTNFRRPTCRQQPIGKRCRRGGRIRSRGFVAIVLLGSW
jgi:hypothetical protein